MNRWRPSTPILLHYHQLFDIYNHYDGMVNLYDVNAGAAAAPVAVEEDLYAFLDWCANTIYPETDGATNIAAGAVLSPLARRPGERQPGPAGGRPDPAGAGPHRPSPTCSWTPALIPFILRTPP